ncbi:hypothetical protein TNCV_1225201 [Trichonephila clavipes]|nr:hypothetical protein TNCV_1225201 [Trichonephila clavipes]
MYVSIGELDRRDPGEPGGLKRRAAIRDVQSCNCTNGKSVIDESGYRLAHTVPKISIVGGVNNSGEYLTIVLDMRRHFLLVIGLVSTHG